jgi:transposase-like protein
MHTHNDSRPTRRVRRRTNEQRRALVDRFLKSGLKEKDFCKQEGLVAGTFARWRRRLLAEDHLPDFVELQPPVSPPTTAAASRETWTIEIDLPGGGCLRVRSAR